jgi:hypothetical protein
MGPAHPLSQSILGALFPEIKRPGLQNDHSPLSDVEVKNVCSYTSFLRIHFHGICRDDLIFDSVKINFCTKNFSV